MDTPLALFSNCSDYGRFGFEFSPRIFRGIDPSVISLLEAAGNLADAIGNYYDALANFNNGGTDFRPPFRNPAPVDPPNPWESGQPSGGLKVNGDVITTAGGYKIEMLNQFEWKITGPDGKTTRVWGDPHVDEGDSGKFDFKRNSTFVLGDGTRINVTTVPYGNGATVTGSLEIISGNDRVLVTDIDKGKGKIGTVTQDGYQNVNSFAGNDVFVMGRETDDWSYKGKEIIGSKDGGESFETGGDLHPGNSGSADYRRGFDFMNLLLDKFLSSWIDSSWRPNDVGYNPYYDNSGSFWEGDNSSRYDRSKHLRAMADVFHALADAYQAIARFMSLRDEISIFRNRHSIMA